MFRSLLTCAALLTLCACASEVVEPGPGGGAVAPPAPCTGGDCPLGRRCVNRVCVGDADWAPSTDVEAAVAEAARRGCARLRSDCAHVCESVFASCHPSVDACVMDETTEYLQDYAFPVADPLLAAQCAAQVEAAPCSDLTPDTLECEFAIVETCPSSESLGLNQSPFHAAPLELDRPHRLHLCDRVAEYFAIELDAGERVRVTGEAEEDERVNLELNTLLATSTGAARLDDTGGYFAADGDLSAPAPEAGTYLLRIEAFTRTGEFTLRVERE